MNITLEKLKKTHGDNAKEVFQQIAKIGGFGDPGENFDGGLDLTGLDETKRAQVDALIAGKKVEKEK